MQSFPLWIYNSPNLSAVLQGFQQVAIQILQLPGDDGHIEQRLAGDRDSVLVAAVTHCLDVAVSIEPSDQAAEATFVLFSEKTLLQIESEPTGNGDQIERFGEGQRWDIAETKRSHCGQAVCI